MGGDVDEWDGVYMSVHRVGWNGMEWNGAEQTVCIHKSMRWRSLF